MKSARLTTAGSHGCAPAVQTVRGLVRAARGTATQKAFGALLGGVDQALVSRYEAGTVDPPSKVIETCMQLLQAREETLEYSATAIAQRIQTELQGDEHAELRRAFVYMLDHMKPKRVGRPPKAK